MSGELKATLHSLRKQKTLNEAVNTSKVITTILKSKGFEVELTVRENVSKHMIERLEEMGKPT